MRFRAFSILALSLAVSAQAATTVPSVPGGIEGGASARLFVDHEDLSYLAELNYIDQTDHRQLKSGEIGVYDQLFENLKIGAFYSRAYGLRHDEDWTDTSGNWAWNDTGSRGEDLLIGDVTPVADLGFLPGKNWVGEVKTRYVYDAFNGQQTLIIRPGLRYFLLKEDRPFMSFFFQLQGNFPLNYGVGSLYEKWIYLGALYRAADHLDLGGFAAAKWETWGSTSDFLNNGGAPYAITAQTWDLTVVAIFHLDLE